MFDVPVRMSRHPELNEYIAEIVTSVRSWLRRDTVTKVIFAVLDRHLDGPSSARPRVLERFVFDLDMFGEVLVDELLASELREHLSSFLLKLNVVDSLLSPNPKGSSWTVILNTNQYKTVLRPKGEPGARMREQQERTLQWPKWLPTDDSKYVEIPHPQVFPLRETKNASLDLLLYVEETQDKVPAQASLSLSGLSIPEKTST